MYACVYIYLRICRPYVLTYMRIISGVKQYFVYMFHIHIGL